MVENKTCRICKVKLTDENWTPSYRKTRNYICKKCNAERARLWRKMNPDEARIIWIKAARKKGMLPMSKNKECAAFLGIHIAERVLSYVFKDVKIMPYGNVGYDFICNHGKKIDVKSSCLKKNGKGWDFNIKCNIIADYFLCLAFDDRENLNPLYIWLIPGNKLSHIKNVGIRPSTAHKWNEYSLDISRISTCCDAMR